MGVPVRNAQGVWVDPDNGAQWSPTTGQWTSPQGSIWDSSANNWTGTPATPRVNTQGSGGLGSSWEAPQGMAIQLQDAQIAHMQAQDSLAAQQLAASQAEAAMAHGDRQAAMQADQQYRMASLAAESARDAETAQYHLASLGLQRQQIDNQYQMDLLNYGLNAANYKRQQRMDAANIALQEAQFKFNVDQLNAQIDEKKATLSVDALKWLAERSGPQDWTRQDYVENGGDAPTPTSTASFSPLDIINENLKHVSTQAPDLKSIYGDGGGDPPTAPTYKASPNVQYTPGTTGQASGQAYSAGLLNQQTGFGQGIGGGQMGGGGLQGGGQGQGATYGPSSGRNTITTPGLAGGGQTGGGGQGSNGPGGIANVTPFSSPVNQALNPYALNGAHPSNNPTQGIQNSPDWVNPWFSEGGRIGGDTGQPAAAVVGDKPGKSTGVEEVAYAYNDPKTGKAILEVIPHDQLGGLIAQARGHSGGSVSNAKKLPPAILAMLPRASYGYSSAAQNGYWNQAVPQTNAYGSSMTAGQPGSNINGVPAPQAISSMYLDTKLNYSKQGPEAAAQYQWQVPGEGGQGEPSNTQQTSWNQGPSGVGDTSGQKPQSARLQPGQGTGPSTAPAPDSAPGQVVYQQGPVSTQAGAYVAPGGTAPTGGGPYQIGGGAQYSVPGLLGTPLNSVGGGVEPGGQAAAAAAAAAYTGVQPAQAGGLLGQQTTNGTAQGVVTGVPPEYSGQTNNGAPAPWNSNPGAYDPYRVTVNTYSPDVMNATPILRKIRGDFNGVGFRGYGKDGNFMGAVPSKGITRLPVHLNLRTLSQASPSETDMLQGVYDNPESGLYWKNILAMAQSAAPSTRAWGLARAR